jgi:ribosomal RNA-processing protein 9
MSSFFTVPASQKKRKRPEGAEGSAKKRSAKPERAQRPPPKQRKQQDDDISGSDSDSDDGPRKRIEDEVDLDDASSASEAENETAAERRLRLAERYLDNIREEVDEHGFDAEEIDRDLIAERLQEDVAESKGRIYRSLANTLSFSAASHTLFRNNTESVSSIAVCPPYAYTVSKDITLTKWKLQDLPKDQWQPKPGKKKSKRPPPPPKRQPERITFIRGDRKEKGNNSYRGHTDAILCVAASQDGKYVVTGGRDRRIVVWDAATLEVLRVFSQHRDAVTSLAFRRGTNQMYSASKDRTIKVWSLDELAYVETLFGHQDEVVDIAALAQERCISVGARDRTARLWKVVEETQLVFRGGGEGKKSKSNGPRFMEGSMDRVAMIDEEMFVTGSDNGSLALWVIHKKKPLHIVNVAHGIEPRMEPDEATAEITPREDRVPEPQARWITALATIPYSDVILTGSWDGMLRAWRVSEDRKKIERLGVVGSVAHPHGIADEAERDTEEMEVDGEEGALVLAEKQSEQPVVKGVINDISVFERGERGKDGVCIVVAVGKEHRFGRWQKEKGKNGAIVFEVPKLARSKKNDD